MQVGCRIILFYVVIFSALFGFWKVGWKARNGFKVNKLFFLYVTLNSFHLFNSF